MIEGIAVAVISGVVSGLILWRAKGWLHGRSATSGSDGELVSRRESTSSFSAEPGEEEGVEPAQIEIVAVLARAQPDEWLSESSISRRLNLRVDPSVSPQMLRFHLETLEEADMIAIAEPEARDTESYYQLTAAGREFAVAMDLVA